MSTKILFEDNPNTPSSILLSNSINGNDIIFCSGNSRITNTLLNMYNKADFFIVYIDVVPDNLLTLDAYYQILEYANKHENIAVIPIFCIEYYIIKTLVRYTEIKYDKKVEDFIKYLVDNIDIGKLSKENLEFLMDENIEHIMKATLNGFDICMHNSNSSKNKASGMFYNKDCNCITDKFICKNEINDIISKKANKMYVSLPLFVIGDKQQKLIESTEIEIEHTTIDNAKRKMQILYNKLCDQLNIARITIK